MSQEIRNAYGDTVGMYTEPTFPYVEPSFPSVRYQSALGIGYFTDPQRRSMADQLSEALRQGAVNIPNFSIAGTPVNHVPRDENQFNGSESWHNAIKEASKVDSSKATPTLFVRNRSTAFGSFLAGAQKFIHRFWRDGKFSVPQKSLNSKKRIKYWAAQLFEPTRFKFDKVMFIDSTSMAESKIENKTLNAEFDVIPVGMDIWTTLGSIGESDSVNWDMVMLLFIPSKEMVAALGKKDVTIAFTLSSNVHMGQSNESIQQEVTRHIEI